MTLGAEREIGNHSRLSLVVIPVTSRLEVEGLLRESLLHDS